MHLWLVVPRGCTRVGLLHLLGVTGARGRVALLLHRLLASGGATGTSSVRVLVVTEHDLWGGSSNNMSVSCVFAWFYQPQRIVPLCFTSQPSCLAFDD